MIVRTDIPKHLTEGLKIIYNKAFVEQPTVWQGLAEEIPSTKDLETYGWLGATPKMREFIDRRVSKGLSEYGFTIRNKKWECTIDVDIDALEDEQYGQIKQRVSDMGWEAKRHPDELVCSLLKDGFATACYDGQYFFSESHSEGDSGVQSNLGDAVFGPDALKAYIIKMRRLKDDKGKPLGVNPNLLVVPPELEQDAITWVKASGVLAVGVGGAAALAGQYNPFQGRFTVLSPEWLTDAEDWFLLDTRRVKPFLFQSRVAPQFKQLGLTGGVVGESEFHEDKVYYGVRARYNAGYGMWQFAFGSHPTL